ncbi:fatty acid--CoA ligase family protein [soil metagenome]
MTLEALRDASSGSVIAAVDGSTVSEVSGAELLALTAGALSFLDESGFPVGDPIPALLTTSATAQALLLAGAISGRPLAPIGPRLTPRDIAACIGNLSSKHLLADAQHAETATRASELAGVGLVLVDGFEPRDASGLSAPEEDSVIAYLHTSGTTGNPKAVPITDAQVAARTTLLQGVCAIDRDSVIVAASPFHHIAGLGFVLVAMGTGATIVEFAHFSVQAWKDLEVLGPTHAALVATHVEMIVAGGGIDMPSLRYIFYGASVLRDVTLRTLMTERPDLNLIRWYGQTEGSPITWLSPDDHRRAYEGESWRFATVGSALPGVEIRIHEPNAEGVGEIWARAAHLAVVDSDGWRGTGDLGVIDDGYLKLIGRSGDMIIRGGENVYPVEVEKALIAHPGVAAALVIGVPDDVLGQRIRAIVEPEDRLNPPEPEELRIFCRERLAGFKVPVEWEFREQFERNVTGKIVRKPYVAEASGG